MRAAIMPVIAWGLVVLVTDLAARRIPNLYTLGASAFALVFLAITGEAVLGGDWVAVMWGVGFALALTLPGYIVRWLGAGDVKLLFAIALLGGWHAVLVSFCVGALLTALALLVMASARYAGYQNSSRRWLPFGAALSIGLMLSIWVRI
jgi:prepilin peptidase CpaA